MSKKSIIHHFISIFALIAVLLIYFYPTIQGKILVQDDITRSIATSKEARDFRADTGEEALWTNSQFGGMPTFQMNTEYPSNLMRYFEKGLKFAIALDSCAGRGPLELFNNSGISNNPEWELYLTNHQNNESSSKWNG